MIALYRHLKNKQAEKEGGLQQQKQPQNPPACAHRAAQAQRDHSGTALVPQDGPGAEGVAAPPPKSTNGKCEACHDEKRAATKYRWKIITALMLPFALAALDVTIVASALPWIAADFNEVSQLNWIISAFNLTSAAFIPFWGQMADVFGRHWSLQTCILIMMVGSALCTAAPTNAFPVLLLGRGFQGLGCAGITVIVRVIIADKVSLKENAKNWSIFALTSGMSYGLGPVIGGYLTNTNWRWCFGINLPICAAAVLLVFLIIRKDLLGPRPITPRTGADGADSQDPAAAPSAAPNLSGFALFSARLSTVDAIGQVLFLFGFGLIILALTWAGAAYSWNSSAVLSPLCIGSVLVAVFLLHEKRMAAGGAFARRFSRQTPMIPWELLSSKDVGLLCYINFATGAAMYAVLYFCNLYFTMVKAFPASQAGVQLLYYTPGLGVGVVLASLLCNRFPRKTFVPIMLGSVIEAVGIGVLAWALYSEQTATIYGMMGLAGAGTGMRFLPVQLHSVGFFPNNIATVISLMAVTLPFGGTVGLTVMTTVFNNLAGTGTGGNPRNFEDLQKVTGPSRDGLVQPIKMAIVWSYVAIVPFLVLCVLAASLLGNVDITKDAKGESSHRVVRGVYLLRLFRKRRPVLTNAEAGDAEAGDAERQLKAPGHGVN